ncbi:hypothetical protein [Devosia sp. CAU 1758]
MINSVLMDVQVGYSGQDRFHLGLPDGRGLVDARTMLKPRRRGNAEKDEAGVL